MYPGLSYVAADRDRGSAHSQAMPEPAMAPAAVVYDDGDELTPQ